METQSHIEADSKLSRPVLWGTLTSFGLLLALFSFIADQLFKLWMLQVVDIAAAQPIVVTPFFSFVLAWNEGVSYGWFSQAGEAGRLVLIALSALASVFLWVWLARTSSPLSAAGLGIVIGGAVGNLADRVIHGAVADFFLFHAYGYSWYVFNIADVAIVAGVLALLYDSLRESRQSEA
ncbi:MAG TPA: signal peptidase II [Aestuariivirgaceae bacterium]|jgi:signal peptidase II